MLSRAEAAKYLGVSVRTLDRYAETKRIPFHFEQGKTRPRKVFDEVELQAFKAACAAARARMLPDRRTPEAMERVGFRLEPEDLKLLRRQAETRGESPGSYARHLVIVALHQQPAALETIAELQVLHRMVAELRDEVAGERRAPPPGMAPALVDLQRVVQGLRDDFVKALVLVLTELTDADEADAVKHIQAELRRGAKR